MKRNEKGFTLIELLAVIVILGLLMAIAIPSVTKYITESRVKTLTKTMDSYITAVVQEVNDGEYKFSDSTKIYAIPIECVSLEKGGTNPFGEWMQANDNYWAYVLVQYDSENYNYKYGFTFKDSAGYGMYPTLSEKIGEKKDQVKTGYDDLTKPTSDKAVNFVSADKWDGFEITDDTELIVLESESEGNVGNGETTCTLCQKGDNYDAIEEEKENIIKDHTLIKAPGILNSLTHFWKYRDNIKNITFQDSINIPNEISDEYKWDVSLTGKGKVMAYITPNSADSSYYDLYIQGDGKVYANPDSSRLFAEFEYLDSINNIEILDTSKVTDMTEMFVGTGRSSKVFKLDLGDNFDTKNVKSMLGMFMSTGYKSPVFTLDLGDKFDTSNVKIMYRLFYQTGYSNPSFTLDLGDKFDTSKATNMANMFFRTGYSSTVFTLDLGDKFDTSNVTNMQSMFETTGYKSQIFTLNLGDKFDTSKVTKMTKMFSSTGRSSTIFTLDLGEKFDTSNVESMSNMFTSTGYSSTIFTLDLGDKFDTSNVKNMVGMFTKTGYSSTIFTLDLGDKFDTSNIKSMVRMFEETGYKSQVFTLDLGDKFDTSNVTNMSYMFNNTGYSSSMFTLNCSNWNVGNVKTHSNFNTGVTSKITPPIWK